METLIFDMLNGLLIMVALTALLCGIGFLFLIWREKKTRKHLEEVINVVDKYHLDLLDYLGASFKTLQHPVKDDFFQKKEADLKKSLSLPAPPLPAEPGAYKVTTTKIFTPEQKKAWHDALDYGTTKPKPKSKKKPVKKS